MQDTIAKFKEEKRAEWHTWIYNSMPLFAPSPEDMQEWWFSQIHSLLTLLEKQVGGDAVGADEYSEGINKERDRIRNLLSLAKQQF